LRHVSTLRTHQRNQLVKSCTGGVGFLYMDAEG
jgi:hypothetical protein